MVFFYMFFLMVVGPTRSLPEKFWEIWPRPSIHHALCRGYEGVFEVPPKLSLRFIASKTDVSTVRQETGGHYIATPNCFMHDFCREIRKSLLKKPQITIVLASTFWSPQMGPIERREPELLDDLGQRIRPDSKSETWFEHPFLFAFWCILKQ